MMRLSLQSKDKALDECRAELQKLASQLKGTDHRQQLETLSEKIGALTAVNENLRERIDVLQREKSELEEVLIGGYGHALLMLGYLAVA